MRRPAHHLARSAALFAGLLAAAAAPAAAAPLTAQDAIRAAWDGNPALAAAAAAALGSREEARRASASRLPSLALVARGVRTDEPMMAFGLRLDQGRIGQADFDPAKLNDPRAIGGWGAGATIQVPLFMGGRLLAGERAAGAAADADANEVVRRRMEVAAAVVEAYFGAQAAELGVRFAGDLVAHASETERFVRERNRQGLALDADLARAIAFRAQAEAERATAVQRRASARSALGLLAGPDAADAELATPLDGPPAPAPVAGSSAGAGGSAGGGAGAGAVTDADARPAGRSDDRPDVAAARLRRDAAESAVALARGSLLPAVFAQASVETLRTADLDRGTGWTTLGVVARWDLSFADGAALRAARARARAAELALEWKRREVSREEGEARRAVETADARALAALEAVAASESARALRDARHRQGLLPLTDVLDAEAGLAGARALLLASRVEARAARARLALATHQPIEDLLP